MDAYTNKVYHGPHVKLVSFTTSSDDIWSIMLYGDLSQDTDLELHCWIACSRVNVVQDGKMSRFSLLFRIVDRKFMWFCQTVGVKWGLVISWLLHLCLSLDVIAIIVFLHLWCLTILMIQLPQLAKLFLR